VSLLLPKVYPLTDVALSGLTHAEQVRRLADGGASLIQLRDKTSGVRELYESAKAALRVARERKIKLIINDRVDLAMAIGADGVHLGQDDLPVLAARELLGPQAIIGLSTHNRSQVETASKLPVDYVALGPIFSTSTKGDTAPELGLEGLSELRDVLGEFPLVAIGGITADRALSVLKAGADSIAVINALLCKPAEISTKTSTLLQLLS
jgi:thiamine-phosphate pyrophosphorylase